jgi:hypothetical protein
MKGPSIDQTLRCYGCDYFDVWWNGGPNLHAKCKEKDKFIPGDHKPGQAGDIKTPGWCLFIEILANKPLDSDGKKPPQVS